MPKEAIIVVIPLDCQEAMEGAFFALMDHVESAGWLRTASYAALIKLINQWATNRVIMFSPPSRNGARAAPEPFNGNIPPPGPLVPCLSLVAQRG